MDFIITRNMVESTVTIFLESYKQFVGTTSACHRDTRNVSQLIQLTILADRKRSHVNSEDAFCDTCSKATNLVKHNKNKS